MTDDPIPPTLRDPTAGAEHDLEVLATASVVSTFLASHPDLERYPGWSWVLGDLNQATSDEVSILHRLGLIGYAPGTYTAEIRSKPRITPLGEQVRDYLRARNG